MAKIDFDLVPYCKRGLKKESGEDKKADEQALCDEIDPLEPQSLILSCLFARLSLVLFTKLGGVIKVFGISCFSNLNSEMEGRNCDKVFLPRRDGDGVWRIAEPYQTLCGDAFISFHAHTSALFYKVPWVLTLTNQL
jgi:hypothetical protein